MGLEVDPAAIVADLPLVQRAQVAIARAVGQLTARADGRVRRIARARRGGGIPPPLERHHLFALVREVAAAGTAVLFVSHDLDEALAITDRITVLRDGRNAATVDTRDVDAGRLIELIVGVAPGSAAAAPTTPAPSARAVGATITGLSGAVVRDVSFAIGAGEVVGLTGLVGSGFDEIPYLIYGALPARGGRLDARETSSTSLT